MAVRFAKRYGRQPLRLASLDRPRNRPSERGQATVEAAFALPVVLLLILLLVQPAILLYDRTIIQSAANEACRLLSTQGADAQARCEDFIRRRLGAIPEQDCFHVHSSGCSYRIETSGNEDSDAVSVSISTEARPLPLLGAGAELLGITNQQGNFEVHVEATAPTQPSWAWSGGSGSASSWAGAWKND